MRLLACVRVCVYSTSINALFKSFVKPFNIHFFFDSNRHYLASIYFSKHAFLPSCSSLYILFSSIIRLPAATICLSCGLFSKSPKIRNITLSIYILFATYLPLATSPALLSAPHYISQLVYLFSCLVALRATVSCAYYCSDCALAAGKI